MSCKLLDVGVVKSYWVRAYDLKRNELHRFFMLAPDVKSILRRLRKIDVPRKVEYALSVQAGAGLVAPHAVYKEVHMYVHDSEGIEFFKKKLDLKDADQGANPVLWCLFSIVFMKKTRQEKHGFTNFYA